MRLTVAEITTAVKGCLLQGDAALSITGVSIDSRSVKAGHIFFAIKGERLDGHRFIKDVVGGGVSVLIVHRRVQVPKTIAVILVDDTTQALGRLAAFYRSQFDIPVIAITGTVGKTTTKDLLTKILKTKFSVLSAKGSFNNHIGVPLTLFQLKKKHQVLVLEVGTNQPGDIDYLAKIVQPTVALLTNIGEGHLEKLKTPAGVFKEKSSLVHHCSKMVVLNQDDHFLSKLKVKGLKKITYAVQKKADYQATHVVINDQKQLSFKVKRQCFVLKTPVYDYVYNALAAIACARLFNVSYTDINQALNRPFDAKNRQNITRIFGCLVINDTYNANPTSSRSAVRTLMALDVKGRRWFVLGDMKELGVHAQNLHRDLGSFVGEQGVDCLVTVGALAKEATKTAAQNGVSIKICRDLKEVQQYLEKSLRPGDGVLVKGSRVMRMEKIIEYLRGLTRK